MGVQPGHWYYKCSLREDLQNSLKKAIGFVYQGGHCELSRDSSHLLNIAGAGSMGAQLTLVAGLKWVDDKSLGFHFVRVN